MSLTQTTTVGSPAHHEFNNDMAMKDMELVHNCASQIRDSLLDGRSSFRQAGTKLPSVHELDTLIDRTGRMMRVLDDAKHRWFSPEHPPRSAKKKSPEVSPPQCHSCKSTETPEWRKGPMGPRTLCNACGLIWAKLSKKRGHDDSDSEHRRQRTRSTSPYDLGAHPLECGSPTSPTSSCSSPTSMVSSPPATNTTTTSSTPSNYTRQSIAPPYASHAIVLPSYPTSQTPSASNAVDALDRNKCAVSFLLS